MFQGMHLTITGDSHVKKGIVCQDSSGVYVGDSFAIAVVADGHGSAKHFRSDAGSRIAVKITVELLKKYMGRGDFREQFKAHPEFILSQMEKQILMKWREAVEEYHLENPLTKEEEEKQAAAGGRLRTAVIYGSTVLAAVIADGFSFGLVLGDGGFVVLDEEGHIFIPVEDKNSHANYTSSLCNTDAVHFLNTGIRKSRCGRCLCPRMGYSSPLPARKIFCVITGCCPRCSGMRSGWRKACGGTLRSAPGKVAATIFPLRLSMRRAIRRKMYSRPGKTGGTFL